MQIWDICEHKSFCTKNQIIQKFFNWLNHLSYEQFEKKKESLNYIQHDWITYIVRGKKTILRKHERRL